MKLKVCGLKYENNIHELIELPIDYMGFIFYKKSPRYIEHNLSYDFMKSVPKHIKKVGVFVNETTTTILNDITRFDLDIIQLHGKETVEQCLELRSHIKIIKAFQINEHFDFTVLENYVPAVDYFLFDSPTPNYGGSGLTFEWKILEKYTYNVPFFLSGGISEAYIEEIQNLKIPQLIAVDINSKFETEPGLKNTHQIKQFITKFKNNGN